MYVLLTVLFLVYVVWRVIRKPKNYPPGPFRTPLIGYGLSIHPTKPHRTFQKLRAQYGDVVGLFFGPSPAVLVMGWGPVNAALANPLLNGRPVQIENQDRFHGTALGIMFTEGEHWQVQRRFTLHKMRNFGFAKKSHEAIIHEEVEELVENLKKQEGPVHIQTMLALSSLNNLWSVVAGKRYSHDHPHLQNLLRIVNDFMQEGQNQGTLKDFLPPLRHVFPAATGYASARRATDQMYDFCRATVKEHRASLPMDESNDFMDAYLHESNKNGTHASFDDAQLEAICFDLLAAGPETSSAFISFCVMFASLHPQWQADLQTEIDEYLAVSGNDLPSYEDRNRMPRTEAFLAEVMRFRGVAPLTVPHRAVQDTTLEGYSVPKDSLVLISIRSVLMDPSYWKNPEEFRPERFLDAEGNFRKDDRLINFGKGKRACPGESLARITGFVIWAGLLSRLSFSLAPEYQDLDTEGTTGFTLAAPHFKVTVTPRAAGAT